MQDSCNINVPICPTVYYTAGWVEVLKTQVKAQKPHVMTPATPTHRVRFESCRGHYRETKDVAFKPPSASPLLQRFGRPG